MAQCFSYFAWFFFLASFARLNGISARDTFNESETRTQTCMPNRTPLIVHNRCCVVCRTTFPFQRLSRGFETRESSFFFSCCQMVRLNGSSCARFSRENVTNTQQFELISFLTDFLSYSHLLNFSVFYAIF